MSCHGRRPSLWPVHVTHSNGLSAHSRAPCKNTPAPISPGFSWHIAAPPLPRFTAQEICHAAVGLNASTDLDCKPGTELRVFRHAKTLTLTFMLSDVINMIRTSTPSVSPTVSPQYPVKFTFLAALKVGIEQGLAWEYGRITTLFSFSSLSYGNNCYGELGFACATPGIAMLPQPHQKHVTIRGRDIHDFVRDRFQNHICVDTNHAVVKIFCFFSALPTASRTSDINSPDTSPSPAAAPK